MTGLTDKPGRLPFADICCWPGCGQGAGFVDAPLCERHLIKAWRIAEDAMRTLRGVD